MKSWSVTSVAVIVLSLASWLAIYRIDGTPPTSGISLMVVGFWLMIAFAVRWFLGRTRGGP
jgi:uncharacterized membrane-anchored protein